MHGIRAPSLAGAACYSLLCQARLLPHVAAHGYAAGAASCCPASNSACQSCAPKSCLSILSALQAENTVLYPLLEARLGEAGLQWAARELAVRWQMPLPCISYWPYCMHELNKLSMAELHAWALQPRGMVCQHARSVERMRRNTACWSSPSPTC